MERTGKQWAWKNGNFFCHCHNDLLWRNAMTDYARLLVSGSSLQEVANSLTRVIQELPPEMSKQLRTIVRSYVGWYGIELHFP